MDELGINEAPCCKDRLLLLVVKKLIGPQGFVIVGESDHLPYGILEEIRIIQEETDGGFVPAGAVAISEERYHTLLQGQAQSKLIITGAQGEPQLLEPAPSNAHELINGEWVLNPDKLAKNIQDKRSALLAAIAAKTDAFKKQFLVGYSEAEIESFYRQEQEARGNLPLMLLTELAAGRGDVDLEQLKAKVIEKADIFAMIMGKLFAVKQTFERRIEQAQDLAELEQIEQEIEQWQKL